MRRPYRRRGHGHDRRRRRGVLRNRHPRVHRRERHRDAGSLRLRLRRDDRDRRDAAGTARHRDDRHHQGDQGRPDGHRERPDAGRRDAAPADAGCCRGWGSDAGPCPARSRTGCYPGAGRRGADPCPARSRTGCSRDAGHRVRHPGAGYRKPRHRPRAVPERPEQQQPNSPERPRRGLQRPESQQPAQAPPRERMLRARRVPVDAVRPDVLRPGARRWRAPRSSTTWPALQSQPCLRRLPRGQRAVCEPQGARSLMRGS
jgi:hypothetical protein